jgi:hypothetical protein
LRSTRRSGSIVYPSSPRTDQISPRANVPPFGLSPSVEESKAALGCVVRQAHHERTRPRHERTSHGSA